MLTSKTKELLHEIIFEADTNMGKLFDIALLIAIIISVIVVMIESINGLTKNTILFLKIIEWILTIIFTIEYILRIMIIKKKLKYIFSFMGIVDFLAIIPTYISIFIAGTHYLVVVRAIRLLRVFRVLKLVHYVKEARILYNALKQSFAKILVFLIFIVVLVVILGSIMYLIEGAENGFTSIPRGVYWAIVTLTTVGYGDIAPKTTIGQSLASIVMILGYAIIAIPTGIISVAIIKSSENINTQSCRDCGKEGHDNDAEYCKYCGYKLNK
jgi:voltage-gated potassium channel